MSGIQTVLGVILSEKLGFCQCHEHIMLSKGVSYEIHKALCMDDIEKSREELLAYKNAGGNSLIDAQPIGCNRMAYELALLSKEVGVNILASTGFHKLQFYTEDHWIHRLTSQEIADIYISELEKGMYIDADNKEPEERIENKATLIKTAYDVEELSARYIRVFDAACQASKKTSAPIMVHIENGTDPLKLLAYFEEKGIETNKLILCHLDRACKDVEIIKEILAKGCYVEFDTIGRFKYHSDEYEIELIGELLQSGFENKILCSLDTTNERMKAYNPEGVGLDYILKTFNYKMLKAGITEAQINKIFKLNCICALTV